MIQRIQTVFLILAIAFAVAFLFVPFGYAPIVDDATHQSGLAPLTATDFWVLIIPTVVAIVLMVITIFLYRNYPLQKKCAILSAIALLATIGVVIYAVVTPYVDLDPSVTVATVWGGGGLLLVGALIGVVAAYRYISKDQRLIRSYDHIR